MGTFTPIKKYLTIGLMKWNIRFNKPDDWDDNLSLFIYVSDNGRLKHVLYTDGDVGGLFQWEDNIDFYVTLGDDDDDFFDHS